MAKREEISSKQEYKNYFKDLSNILSSIYGNIEQQKQVLDSLRNIVQELSLNNYPLYKVNNKLEKNQDNNENYNRTPRIQEQQKQGNEGDPHDLIGRLDSENGSHFEAKGGKLI